MKYTLLKKLEMANEFMVRKRGQPPDIQTLLNNWAISAEILDQIIGEEYEQRDFFCNSCKKEIALAKDKGERE